jgi:hypothetical protein
MTYWIRDWLWMFGLTCGVELTVAMMLLRRAEPRLWRRASGILVANLATHPLVWFVFPGARLSYLTQVSLSEVWAVMAEVLVYIVIWPNLGWRRALLVSFAANAASFLVGIAVQRVLMGA